MSAFKAPLDPSTALGGFSGNNYSEVTFDSLNEFSYSLVREKEGNGMGMNVTLKQCL